MSRTYITNANVHTPLGCHALSGSAMGQLAHVPGATIVIDDGVITAVHPGAVPTDDGSTVIDARGRAVLPGFIDPHTHLIFGGLREDEFRWRMQGDSYMQIMERGGGIVNTMSATRKAPLAELVSTARAYLEQMSRLGITTVEAKSGYGLDRDAELKQLQAVHELSTDPHRKVDLYSTYLGAHALPPEYAEAGHDAYIDFIIAEMLPQARALAQSCDVFCERGVFSIEQSRRLLEAARALGYDLRLHADEMACTGGAELGAELGVLSADHLLHVSDAGISALARAGVVATLLPLTAFTLREPYAPARKMIDAGCAVALGTDFNPGSCFSASIPLIFALACIYMRMTVEEAISAITINAAAALGRAASIGTIEPGKQADMVVLCSPNINILPYYTGMNCVDLTIKSGRVVADNT